MPTEAELEERDFASTFRSFAHEFADLERARGPDDDDDAGPDADAGPAEAAPKAAEVAGAAEAAEAEGAPAVVTEADLQHLFAAHRRVVALVAAATAKPAAPAKHPAQGASAPAAMGAGQAVLQRTCQ
jgi:hypothetical protein